MSYSDYRNWYWKCNVNLIIENLSKRGFKAVYFEDVEEAKKHILSLIPENAVVGIAGSVTIRELGLIELLEARGNKVVHHWIKGLSSEESYRIRLLENNSDVYLSSCNAITFDGVIVNADSSGNRVAALAFGPKIVILVVGINKIVYNVNMALWRIYNIATPMNSRRLGIKIPCVETGYCIDCDSMDCPVRVIEIIERKPQFTDYHVIIINSNLGF
ncbi:MAG: lactate utilization protein [Candidatus Methanomethylicia archaeon]|nr:lactate utilization protein [Candidatus Methanomethylicia archaeon]